MIRTSFHGQQEGSSYNGHFESVCYHPLMLFNHYGDCLAAQLRPGHGHSVQEWDELLLPEIERHQAESWSKPRRVGAKVEHHPGELFPRVGFIVTNISLPSRSLVRFYNNGAPGLERN